MAYSENLVERIRAALASRDDVVEQRMFGGIAFMVRGSMACGTLGDDLMARVGPEGYEAALARPHAKIMDFTGRPLRGFVRVEAQGLRTAAALKKWVDESASFAASLPAKKSTSKRAGPPKKMGSSAKRKGARK